MSSSIDAYWKTANRMLRKNQIDFNQPTSSEELPVFLLILTSADCLKKRIQFAIENFKEIARLEYEFNDGQPEKTTLKHLQWAKVFIESDQKVLRIENVSNSTVLNARSYVSIGQFLLDCHVAVELNTSGFTIQTDAKRKALIEYIFDQQCSSLIPSTLATVSSSTFGKATCTQLIFESADVASSIDELLINLSDRTWWSPWRIRAVYIQESIRNTVLDLLSTERLNTVNSINNDLFTEERKRKNDELAKRFGGKLLCSKNGTICLLLGVPPQYILQTAGEYDFSPIPIAVNFFRTAKEAIQMTKTSVCLSIWTENINVFYEVAAEVSANIVWSNCLGMFDKIMPPMTIHLDSKQPISTASTINTKGRYAVQILLDGANKIPKYLYILYGKIFAN